MKFAKIQIGILDFFPHSTPKEYFVLAIIYSKTAHGLYEYQNTMNTIRVSGHQNCQLLQEYLNYLT